MVAKHMPGWVEVKTSFGPYYDYASSNPRPRRSPRLRRLSGLRTDLRTIVSALRGVGGLSREAKEFGADVILERPRYLDPTGLLVARRSGARYCLHLDGQIVQERRDHFGGSPSLALAAALERQRVRRAEKIITISRKRGDLAISEGADPGKINVVSNGVEIEPYESGSALRLQTRQELGIDKQTVVGFVGSLQTWHGVELLVEAGARLQTTIPEILFLVVGDGPMKPELERRVRALGLERMFMFLGTRPFEDVPRYVSAADICAVPGLLEYLSPMKLFEYGAAGKPTICADIACVREVVSPGVHACMFQPGDVGGLADGITFLHRNPDRAAAMGTALKAAIEEGYTWKHLMNRMATVLSSA